MRGSLQSLLAFWGDTGPLHTEFHWGHLSLLYVRRFGPVHSRFCILNLLFFSSFHKTRNLNISGKERAQFSTYHTKRKSGQQALYILWHCCVSAGETLCTGHKNLFFLIVWFAAAADKARQIGIELILTSGFQWTKERKNIIARSGEIHWQRLHWLAAKARMLCAVCIAHGNTLQVQNV